MHRFYRGGHVVVRRERARRSTEAQQRDPFTVVVALDDAGRAAGDLYLDDGSSFAFEKHGAFLAAAFAYEAGTLRYTLSHAGFASELTFERIVVLGLPEGAVAARAEAVHVESGAALDASAAPLVLGGAERGALAVRRVALPVDEAWSVRLWAGA